VMSESASLIRGEIDRRLTHKSRPENVFVVGVSSDPGMLSTRVLLPRQHHFYTDPETNHHDLLLVAEAARQSWAVIAHQQFGVPFESRFVITQAVAVAHSKVALQRSRSDGLEPVCEMIVDFRIDQVRRRSGGALRGLRGEAMCIVAGVHAASFDMNIALLDSETYHAVRNGHAPVQTEHTQAPAPPDLVGRVNPANVVISTPRTTLDRASALLCPDMRHPVFFDHTQDHYTGMLILEACRQLTTALIATRTGRPASGFTLVRCGGTFKDFAEFSSPVTLDAVASGTSASVTVSQDGKQLTEAQVELSMVEEGR
jgi:2-oxo-3-(phosphooxy)propyl 3-oxoalkanoate synthase